MDNFKPMLAGISTTPHIPCIASPKLDGIRCVIKDGIALSRTLKPIPNKEIQRVLSALNLDGLDGELIVGDPNSPTAFKRSTSFVMSKDKVGEPWIFWVFDDFTLPLSTFSTRYNLARNRVNGLGIPDVKIVPQTHISTIGEYEQYESHFVSMGFEGMMTRSASGRYKYGRSTEKEEILLKVKRFKDGEATIIGFEELMTNDNPKEINELGDSKRSSHKEGKIPADTLGSMLVKDLVTNVEFSIGSGFNANGRKYIWKNQSIYIGRVVKYKYFEIGNYDKPRFPIYLGIRSNLDM